MLKSILLVFAAGLVVAAPLAMAGRAPQQQPQTPAAAEAAAPAQPAAAQATPEPQAAPPAGSMPTEMKNPVLKPTAESQAKAKQLYAIDCAMCHGDNGNGKTDLATSMAMTLPDLTDSKSLAGHLDGALFNLIRNGKDKMPGEDKARASDTDVWNLVIYVRNMSKPTTAASTK